VPANAVLKTLITHELQVDTYEHDTAANGILSGRGAALKWIHGAAAKSSVPAANMHPAPRIHTNDAADNTTLPLKILPTQPHVSADRLSVRLGA
jgi:hypothetical protein